MKKISHRSSFQQTIIYIIPQLSSLTDASHINTLRRKNVLERLGHKVIVYEHDRSNFIKQVTNVIHLLKRDILVIVRVDGSCELEKYSILKILYPYIRLFWEIHGVPEERLAFSQGATIVWWVWKNTIKRKALSFLTNGCIFISKELKRYSRRKLYSKNLFVIPNFIDISEKPLSKFSFMSQLLKEYFIVLWGGDSRLPWQAIDVIEQVAKNIYNIDKKIVFLIVGPESWHPISFNKNIVHLNSLPHKAFLNVIRQAGVCLALYHQPKYFPFYFYPLKLLDYLQSGKPIIATDLGTISSLIRHGQNGFTTNNSIEDISRKILRIKRDPKLANTLGKNARQTALTVCSARQATLEYAQMLEK